MDKGTLILLVDQSPVEVDSIRRVLAHRANHFRVQRVEDVPTALARILGGGVDIVLINLPASVVPGAGSNGLDAGGERLLPFLELRNKAQGLPVVVLCASADESLAEAAIREGATDFLIREAYDVDLLRVLRSVAAKAAIPTAPLHAAASRKGGQVLVFMGSKGGAGATTVTLNVAAALARDHRVVLAEFPAEIGALAHYFQPHRSIRDLGDLLRAQVHQETQAEAIPTGEVEACLWPCKNLAGLRVLFGSRNPEIPLHLSPAKAHAILADLTELADYVVVDLPVSLSAANRVVIEGAAFFTLVVERDSLAVEAAKLVLRAVDGWKASHTSRGVVIVNRSPLVSPLPFAEIEAQLAIPILGVIPPAPDLCAAAQHAHIPLVSLDADSLPALAFVALSRVIAQQVPLPQSNALTGPAVPPLHTPSHGMYRVGVR